MKKLLMLSSGSFSCAGATPQDSLEAECIQCASDSDGNRLVANDVLRACGGALRICVGTCPDRS